MMQDIKKQLQSEIMMAEAELNMKKLLLDQLSRKPEKHFFETSVGKGLHKTLAFMLEPFAQVHSASVIALKDPVRYKAEKLLIYARKVHLLCKKIKDNSHPHAKKFAMKAAQTRMALERFLEEVNGRLPDGYELNLKSESQFLHEEVSRLRPPRTEEQQKAAEGIVETFTAAAEDLMEKLQGQKPQEA
jgi:hypothetical protein